MAQDLAWIDAYLAEHGDELVAFRRELHSHPELSSEEHATTDRIVTRLRAAGLDPWVLSSGTGVVCDVGEGDDVVALRADIDALAMDDEKDVPYRSQVPGVAHACGHDVHTAIVLGAGLGWLHNPGAGRIRLVFEPAEESVPGGAPGAIADGVLDGVVAMIGMHCDPRFDSGHIALRDGPASGAADLIKITLTGPGGHTARPNETVDLVSVAGALAHELPDLVQERSQELGGLSLVFGSINAGHASNVIPTHATLRGSVRTPDPRAWAAAERMVNDAVAGWAGRNGARIDVDYARGVPPVVNNESVVATVRAAAADVLDDTSAVEAAPRTQGGDSFAWFSEQAPCCYVRLGVHDPDSTAARVDLHAGSFDVDERSIATGVKVLLASAARLGD